MARITFNYSKVKTDETHRIMSKYMRDEDLTDAEWKVLKLEGVIARVPAHVKDAPVAKKSKAKLAKANKEITARFIGTGFKQEGNLINSKSKTSYCDPDAFKEKRYTDQVYLILQQFQPGITAVLKNKKIKPGSLRITFSFEE